MTTHAGGLAYPVSRQLVKEAFEAAQADNALSEKIKKSLPKNIPYSLSVGKRHVETTRLIELIFEFGGWEKVCQLARHSTLRQLPQCAQCFSVSICDHGRLQLGTCKASQGGQLVYSS